MPDRIPNRRGRGTAEREPGAELRPQRRSRRAAGNDPPTAGPAVVAERSV